MNYATVATSSTLQEANLLLREGKLNAALEAYNRIQRQRPELGNTIRINVDLIERRLIKNRQPKPDGAEDSSAGPIFVGIAAIPERMHALEKTVESLLPQVTKLGVYLNGWPSVPEFLKHEKILIEGYGAADLGDVGKFYWLDEYEGIYFSCDDDLVYPPDYIARTVAKLAQYNNRAAVGWHGSLLREPFNNYYDQKSRRVFLFSAHRPWDTPVHILGTGCSAFDTRILKVRKADFSHPNMADIFFSIKGQEQKIPFVVIEHEKGEIKEFEGAQTSSIYSHSLANLESKKNTHEIQNHFVKKNVPWVLNQFSKLSILIVGRFENYAKGGIYKSCHLIRDHLQGAGHKVDVCDTENDLIALSYKKYDFCWIYPGDPERPDFKTVEEKIDQLQQFDIPVIVNLSYLYTEERSGWLKKKLIDLNRDKSCAVLGAVFTESAANDPLLSEVREYLCVVPKTILPTPYEGSLPSFGQREGICLGDATKLGNGKIIGGDINPWVEAIHRRLPHVNLYAFKQYQGKDPHPRIKYVPHMKADFGKWLAHRRVFVCANVHLTFEMVACEAQSFGTPVVYRHMPHSLSEYISATGFAVRNPEEMAEMVAWLYNNEKSWNKISEASIANARSNHVDLLDASLEGYLRLALSRIKTLQAR